MSFISKNLQFILALAGCLTISNTVTAGTAPSRPERAVDLLPPLSELDEETLAKQMRDAATMHSRFSSRSIEVALEMMREYIADTLIKNVLTPKEILFASVPEDEREDISLTEYNNAIEIALHLLYKVSRFARHNLTPRIFKPLENSAIDAIITDWAGPLSCQDLGCVFTEKALQPYLSGLETDESREEVREFVIIILTRIKDVARQLPV